MNMTTNKMTPAAREAAKTESQRQAVRDFELFYGCERISEGASADWLCGYAEAIANPGESVDSIKRAILVQYNARPAGGAD